MKKAPKKLLKELAKYDFCLKIPIPPDELSKIKNDSDKVLSNNTYLCDFDDYTNTRILLGIFKCVNFIKNMIIAALACGVVAAIITIIK